MGLRRFDRGCVPPLQKFVVDGANNHIDNRAFKTADLPAMLYYAISNCLSLHELAGVGAT